jgi:hypothetical protein
MRSDTYYSAYRSRRQTISAHLCTRLAQIGAMSLRSALIQRDYIKLNQQNSEATRSMNETTAQNLLAANAGDRRVTIGLNSSEELRSLSDARALTCPACGSTVVMHAGTVRAHHFAHLPGAICRLPQTELETEEHRAGKLLLARWLRERLPEAEVIVEAFIPVTGQRADVLAVLHGTDGAVRRIALEYQCANLLAREWRRRHRSYRNVGIEDLWLLGGSRLVRETKSAVTGTTTVTPAPDGGAGKTMTLRTTELERALLLDGAPLLFLDSTGEQLQAERLARFRPDAVSQAVRPTGRLVARPLSTLDFPFALLAWPANAQPAAPATGATHRPTPSNLNTLAFDSDSMLWQWLAERFMVTSETVAPFFGLPLPEQPAFACTAQAWQAAIYYRFVHRRVGDNWWLTEVETWARSYLPLTRPVNLPRLKAALATYQEVLGAAGMLSLPMGYGRVHARITADLNTLPSPPDQDETLRLARYRRTLNRETRAEYLVHYSPVYNQSAHEPSAFSCLQYAGVTPKL